MNKKTRNILIIIIAILIVVTLLFIFVFNKKEDISEPEINTTIKNETLSSYLSDIGLDTKDTFVGIKNEIRFTTKGLLDKDAYIRYIPDDMDVDTYNNFVINAHKSVKKVTEKIYACGNNILTDMLKNKYYELALSKDYEDYCFIYLYDNKSIKMTFSKDERFYKLNIEVENNEKKI